MMQAIFCRFQIAGVHYHPGATDEFERSIHRHIFHIEVVLNAAALMTDGESLTPVRLRQICLDQFDNTDGVYHFDVKQTLEIARWLGRALTDAFEDRGVRVTVSEDGENGAIVSYGLDPHYEDDTLDG